MTDEHDPVGQALRSALAATDELVVLTNAYETRYQVLENPKAIDRILANVQLIASLIDAQKPRMFKVYNGKTL